MDNAYKELIVYLGTGMVGVASYLARSLVELIKGLITERFDAISKRLERLEDGHIERVESLARIEQLSEQTAEDVTRFAQALDRLVNKPR